jgi:putative transposase
MRHRRPNGQRERSARDQQTLDQITRLRAREARIRGDFLHKPSTELANSHGLIAIEDLKVRSMTRTAKGTRSEPAERVAQKRGLNRSILAQGWGELHRQLRYKTSWYGSQLVAVPAAHTSQTRSACGVVHGGSRESPSAVPVHRLPPSRTCGCQRRAGDPRPRGERSSGQRTGPGRCSAESPPGVGRGREPRTPGGEQHDHPRRRESARFSARRRSTVRRRAHSGYLNDRLFHPSNSPRFCAPLAPDELRQPSRQF